MANAQKKPPAEPVTDLVTTERSQMQTTAAATASGQDVVASDVIIPRLLLMQAISPLVTSRKAQIGDLIRSTTGEKLGDPEKPLQLIALSMQNTWIDFEKVVGENQPRFRGMHPRGVTKRNELGQAVETNEMLPWTFSGANGEDMFRRKAIILYALVPSDIAAYTKELQRALETGDVPDLSKGVSPVVITFQSTSFKYAGKQIATFFNNVKKTNFELAGKMTVAPFDYILTLKCREEKKGSTAWYVFELEGSPKRVSSVFTDKAEAESIKEKSAFWLQALSAGKVQVDDSGEVDEGTGGTGAAELEV